MGEKKFKRHAIYNWHWDLAKVDQVQRMAALRYSDSAIARATECSTDELERMAARNGIVLHGEAGSGA